jgi:hypothetical protein
VAGASGAHHPIARLCGTGIAAAGRHTRVVPGSIVVAQRVSMGEQE